MLQQVDLFEQRANSVWYVDLIVINKKKEKGQKYSKLDKVILCCDAFSKYAWVKVINDTKNSKKVTKAMKEIIEQEKPNLPNVIHSDNGSEFEGDFKKLLKEHKIIHRLSRAYTPIAF